MTFDAAIYPLRLWFAERNIDTDGIALILNVSSRNAAAALDAELHHDLSIVQMGRFKQQFDVREFTLRGLKIKLESPLHTP